MENNPFEQFLTPLIEAIVLKPGIQVDVRKVERSVIANVVVDKDDQPLIIGEGGQNVIALTTLFKEWCMTNYQCDGRLAVLEPTESKPTKGTRTKKNGHKYLQDQAEWLTGELFPNAKFKVSVTPKEKAGEVDLEINISEFIEAPLLSALTRYFRTAGKNHGLTAQIYVHRNLARGASAR